MTNDNYMSYTFKINSGKHPNRLKFLIKRDNPDLFDEILKWHCILNTKGMEFNIPFPICCRLYESNYFFTDSSSTESSSSPILTISRVCL